MKKYNIYNSSDNLVAVITDKEKLSLEIMVSDKNQLPFLLQSKSITSEKLERFLKSRVLPNRPTVKMELNRHNLKYNWREMIKLNSGRVMTDDFYVLVEENGIEISKVNKTDMTNVGVVIEDNELERTYEL